MNQINASFPAQLPVDSSVFQTPYGRRKGIGAYNAAFTNPQPASFGPAAILDLSPAASDMVRVLDKATS
jgi:hypothetical protein